MSLERRARFAAFVAVLAHAMPAFAAEPRRVELSSGRVLLAEIVATRADGLDLQTPQGIVSIRFDEVQRLDPVDVVLYEQQPPMRILQLPSPDPATNPVDAAFDAELHADLLALPATRVRDRTDADGQSAVALPALIACGPDAVCVAKAAALLDVDVVFLPTPTAGKPWLRAIFPGAADANGGLPVDTTLAAAVYQMLRLNPPAPVPPPPVADAHPSRHVKPSPVAPVAPPTPAPSAPPPPAPRPAPSPAPSPPPSSPSTALSLTPIPGLPEFRSGHPARGLLALAIALPATAGAVYLAGTQAERPWDVVAIGAATWWVASVATSRALAPVVVPTATEGHADGATVAVVGRF